MTMRDGTKLAYSVHPPTDVANVLGFNPPEVPQGPSPTLIEYAGYAYAQRLRAPRAASPSSRTSWASPSST